MKKIIFATMVVFGLVSVCFAADSLLIDDFEGAVSGGAEGTVDFGAGNGSNVNVTASTDIKNSGNQAIKVDFTAAPGGYIFIARGKDLDAKNANWQIKPEDIKWEEYSAISFYMYGNDTKKDIAFDVKDGGGELWRYIIKDDFKGWKKIVCSFDKFYVRDDWQPDTADKNAKLDFSIASFQFEPLPDSSGTYYFDTVELVKK
ncbi:MAG: hypothetical protein HZC15_05185 [Candidatus Omnitrophica bacterium]|jgi:hypothetical protein|nr:hypothetical protein [Candidatus Omnitrophota bacterium]